ncbi:MAG: hypothetical protein M3R70_00615 [Actinomycetota bacterium]|nr:hypothetical protein [Actinomycetota bacterium]
MAVRRRPLCADLSRENSEPLAATASRIDHWLLVEYPGLWGRQPLAAGILGEEVKAHLRSELRRLGPARLLFIKRPERRRQRDVIRVFYGSTLEQDARFFCRELASYDDLVDVVLGDTAAEPLDHPLFVVCTHGKRDRCCAVYGRPLYEALRDQVDDDWVWQSTHVGGDRFAGNIVSFPHGLYFGRVGPADVSVLLAATVAGRVPLEHYRGRCCYSFPEQAAERALREELGLDGIDDFTLVHTEPRTDRWLVSFRTRNGELHEKTIGAERGEPALLTCDAKAPGRPLRFCAVS